MSSKRPTRKSTRASETPVVVEEQIVQIPAVQEEVSMPSESSDTLMSAAPTTSTPTETETVVVAAEPAKANKVLKMKKQAFKRKPYLTYVGKTVRNSSNGLRVKKDAVKFLTQTANRLESSVAQTAIQSASRSNKKTINADDIYNAYRFHCGNSALINKCIAKAKVTITNMNATAATNKAARAKTKADAAATAATAASAKETQVSA